MSLGEERFSIESLRIEPTGPTPDWQFLGVTVLEIIQKSSEFLEKKGIESARLQSELLLAAVLKVARLKLYMDFQRVLSPSEVEQMRAMIKRRGAREPLQHIVGTTHFCGLELKVSPDVLVPRPETELLAEKAWQYIDQLVAAGRTGIPVLDLGTGSGCLGLSIAQHSPHVKVTAVDVSEAALNMARMNAERSTIKGEITFAQSNAFEGLAGQAYALIVSNPPYIPSAEIETLMPEVKDYDPRLALDGGADGLDFYRLIAAKAGAFLEPQGKILLEFGDGQAPSLQELFSAQNWIVEGIHPDYSGRARILAARKA